MNKQEFKGLLTSITPLEAQPLELPEVEDEHDRALYRRAADVSEYLARELRAKADPEPPTLPNVGENVIYLPDHTQTCGRCTFMAHEIKPGFVMCGVNNIQMPADCRKRCFKPEISEPDQREVCGNCKLYGPCADFPGVGLCAWKGGAPWLTEADNDREGWNCFKRKEAA